MTLEHSALGKKTAYQSSYDKTLLWPIPRALNRANLGLTSTLPFNGMDIWNAYELSWLNEKGKPEVMIAEFKFPCHSSYLIESKSFKLYLNSFNQTRFKSPEIVKNIMQYDLSAATASKVQVTFQQADKPVKVEKFQGMCLDELDITVDDYQTNPELLFTQNQTIEETVYSNLLKSNCPVTSQPDWASIMIHYSGQQIEATSLLKYIISYREHSGFHEDCIERIFMDIMHQCQPEKLTVYARYTRRGGLDINPFRSNFESSPNNLRLSRQ